MSNRVTELERQVSELQAAVNGLTEELVETKERVRQLEADDAPGSTGETTDAGEPAADRGATDQPGAGPTPEAPEPAERTTKSDDHVNVVEQTAAAADSTAAAAEAAEAAADAAAEASGDAETDADEDTTEGDAEESDIIVA
ncbi:DUF7518 family protein [Halopenitus persicus]|uniref:BZIP transcription factor n=1 Tax=Halopenitus persicus TaxID=1048396 RepID=A0A1H3IUQ6_9EURY|nr:hypothetical protein [Halopenitus persicus]QHS17255.1 bZIP transcription factor [haloarchaeon 3A1-DGR]SDY30614.1 hypothetical protein SAMN05216564_104244 [Halopenitus persicus]